MTSVPPVPGIPIAFSDPAMRRYIGSPSLVRCPDGALLASHDYFGPESNCRVCAETRIYRSEDEGMHWLPVATLAGQFWSNLFVCAGALYILGAAYEYGPLAIRRSENGGRTWTTPDDTRSGALTPDGHYHTAPVPVLERHGRLWRSVETVAGWPTVKWGRAFSAAVMSAPTQADLLDAEAWTISEPLPSDPQWLNGCNGWLEGNLVEAPDATLVNILRAEVGSDRAAMTHVADDGKSLTFDPTSDFVQMPGGMTKFAIRRDPATALYWAAGNDQRGIGLDRPPVPKEFPSGAHRNVLVLSSSPDLQNWTIRHTVARHDDWRHIAFQYPDWIFDGEDLLIVSRTAWHGAHAPHDATHMTFHRVPAFRRLADADQANTFLDV